MTKTGLWASVFLLSSVAHAAPSISLVPLTSGLDSGPSARAALARESAAVGGPDLSAPTHVALPDALAVLGKNTFFYALFNNFSDRESPRAYAIQRIRKTAMSYRSANDPNPLTTVEYLVEIFKTRGPTCITARTP
jgi:hypothetical protein